MVLGFLLFLFFIGGLIMILARQYEIESLYEKFEQLRRKTLFAHLYLPAGQPVLAE